MERVLCIRPCFNEDGVSNITVGKIYPIVKSEDEYFIVLNDEGREHMFSHIWNDWDTDPDYFEKIEDFSYNFFYKKFRGNCKEYCEKLLEEFPDELQLKRGYFHEPSWQEKQPHWWLVDKNGKIHDPTALQFPSKGDNYLKNDLRVIGVYEEFDGYANCEECGKKIAEKDFVMQGRYPCCSERCAMKLVGLL